MLLGSRERNLAQLVSLFATTTAPASNKPCSNFGITLQWLKVPLDLQKQQLLAVKTLIYKVVAKQRWQRPHKNNFRVHYDFWKIFFKTCLSHIKKHSVRLVRHEISNNFLIYNLPSFENLFVWQEIKKVWMDPSTLNSKKYNPSKE